MRFESGQVRVKIESQKHCDTRGQLHVLVDVDFSERAYSLSKSEAKRRLIRELRILKSDIEQVLEDLEACDV